MRHPVAFAVACASLLVALAASTWWQLHDHGGALALLAGAVACVLIPALPSPSGPEASPADNSPAVFHDVTGVREAAPVTTAEVA